MGRLVSDHRPINAAEQGFTSLVANVSDYALYILDVDGNVTSWNAGAEKIKGYRADEIVGQHYSRFYPLDARERGMPDANLKQALASGHFEDEGWRVRKDGSRFWASVVITPLYSPDGEHIGFSKITRDLTVHRQLLESLRQQSAELEERTRELQEANTALESFSYSVSHDLRAPLRAMWGFASALSEDYADKLDDTGKQYAKAIEDAAKSMDDLIEDLLAYSRLARTDMQLAPVNLERAIADAQKQIEADLQPAGAQIQVEGALPEVEAHYSTLVQILANLLSNAVKFVAPGVVPKIKVRAEERVHSVRLWVDDNGIGVGPEHQAQIFSPFERLHGVDAYPGTGIGLAIVRKGVERMSGQCGVESELGHGSRFWIELRKQGEN
jgi:PAS domain S-box-containing protein